MKAVVSPSFINGTITAPASKSVMQRACALALLQQGTTLIHNPGKSKDDLAAIKIIEELGGIVIHKNDTLSITSSGNINGKGIIHCGESGLSFRMFASIAALSKNEMVLTGEGSLLKRPMHFFDELFPLLGVKVKTNNGFLPLNLQGPLTTADIVIDGSASSQYLTGLLFTFAKTAEKPVVITVNNLKSKPYIDLSLQMLQYFGYDVQHKDHSRFFVNPVNISEKNIVYTIEGDWSAASFLLVAGAIAGDIRIQGLDIYSVQADLAIMDVLQDAGANISVEGNCVLVNNNNPLKAFEFDATDCPDLFPPLVALAAYCEGYSRIKGVSRLGAKESNRALTLKDVFTKMGIEIVLQDDNMIINGNTGIRGATVSSHHDHRIAMACAVAALHTNAVVTIEHAEVISKSYPDFYDHLQMLGAAVSLSSQ